VVSSPASIVGASGGGGGGVGVSVGGLGVCVAAGADIGVAVGTRDGVALQPVAMIDKSKARLKTLDIHCFVNFVCLFIGYLLLLVRHTL
jgi:hypothetical protein